MKTKKSFFSVGFDLVNLGEELPYDLYINSSSSESREHFIRIHPMGESIFKQDLVEYKKKYFQIYILESQRGLYLKSLVKNSNATDVRKTEVIKDSAIHYLNNVFDPSKEFTTEVLEETIEGCKDSVESMITILEDYDVTEVQSLIADLSFHDFYTYDHSINVSMYCISFYKELNKNASKEELVMAGLGGLLHDLGKIKIPTKIINNPGNLSDSDFEEIKKHPGYGKELLGEDQFRCKCEGVDFEVISKVIYEHHENYNGTGYPNKVPGEEIHLLAKVTAIADFFDAITTKRSYHEALPIEDALAVMEKTAGRKIDPKLFYIFKKSISKIQASKISKELPDDFDPCRPYDVLPFQENEERSEVKNENFGKVISQEENPFSVTSKKKSA